MGMGTGHRAESEGVALQIDKQQIIDFLKSQGDQGKADQADKELPQKVDSDNTQHQNILERLGINPMDLVKQFMGGKGGGLPGL